MFVSDALGVNELDHLTIGGADAVELAGTYGTPLYVMDEGLIRRNARAFRRSIERHYEGKGFIPLCRRDSLRSIFFFTATANRWKSWQQLWITM